jgi:putative nucleotidyltransferase with HDIG domain
MCTELASKGAFSAGKRTSSSRPITPEDKCPQAHPVLSNREGLATRLKDNTRANVDKFTHRETSNGRGAPERILVVDDDAWVAEVIAQQLELAGLWVDATTDSSRVMGMLAEREYDLVILDVDMPHPDGLTLLGEIRRKRPFLAVLILTALNDVGTATHAMRDGASDYIVKPHHKAQLLMRVERAIERSRLLRERALLHQFLERRIKQQTRQLHEQSRKLGQTLERLLVTYQATLNALEAALDVRDQSAPGHCRRVSKLAVRLAERMRYGEKDLVDIEHGALLHDIGKLGIPDAILMKPGPLTDKEKRVVERHPEIGCQIVGHIDFLQGALPIIRHHHERYDGLGYPDGLKGEEIPPLARIFSVVDAFDAQTHQRPYNTVRSVNAAIQDLQANKGTFFDPHVVDEFAAMIGDIVGREMGFESQQGDRAPRRVPAMAVARQGR